MMFVASATGLGCRRDNESMPCIASSSLLDLTSQSPLRKHHRFYGPEHLVMPLINFDKYGPLARRVAVGRPRLRRCAFSTMQGIDSSPRLESGHVALATNVAIFMDGST